ncbi:MAG: hypothetical protein PUC21_04610 [Bacteroidales bacterium]|nr:hypothetical protein [Bacteroidales bacterium]
MRVPPISPSPPIAPPTRRRLQSRATRHHRYLSGVHTDDSLAHASIQAKTDGCSALKLGWMCAMRPESSLTLTRFRLTPYAQRSVRPTSAEAETMTMTRGGHFRHPGGGGSRA